MTEFSGQTGFAPLFPDGHEKYSDVLWPCVVFDDKEAFLNAHDNLDALTHHPAEIRRVAIDEISRLVVPQSRTNTGSPESTNIKLAYLLGGVQCCRAVSRLRAVKASAFRQFESGLEDAARNFGGLTGYREALGQALKLYFGPEFSRARLRCRKLAVDSSEGNASHRKELMWPCLFFDDPIHLMEGLRERKQMTENEEVILWRQFYEMSVQKEYSFPPYIYYFGGNSSLVRSIDTHDCCLEDFKEAIADAMIDNFGEKPFFIALHQAMGAVQGDPSAPPKQVPFAVAAHGARSRKGGAKDTESPAVASALPMIGGEKRVDFGQKHCERCQLGEKSRLPHDSTCLLASANRYMPPSKDLLVMLTADHYKKIEEPTKARMKDLGLHKYLTFRMNKRKKNDPGRPRPRRSCAAVTPIKEEK